MVSLGVTDLACVQNCLNSDGANPAIAMSECASAFVHVDPRAPGLR
jgi:hypothetical protein